MDKNHLAEDFSQRAERVLMEWANLSDGSAEQAKFLKRHPQFFIGFRAGDLTFEIPGGAEDLLKGIDLGVVRDLLSPTIAPVGVEFAHTANVAIVRRLLRKAWDAPDIRHREWLIFKLRERYEHWRIRAWNVLSRTIGKVEVEWSDDPPAMNDFERLMYQFQRVAERARHCPNPECPAPYYFTVKKGQRYCSSKCAAPAQRRAKLIWWREHGAQQRSEERALAKKRQKGRRHGKRQG